MTPSLERARAELRRRLGRIDNMHAQAIASLPDGHTWHDVDLLEIERCEMVVEAHEDFKAAKAEWNAYVFAHGDDDESGTCLSCQAKGINWDTPREDGTCYECGEPVGYRA